MAVQAVIFDWGGTMTPWHPVDHEALWLEVLSLIDGAVPDAVITRLAELPAHLDE